MKAQKQRIGVGTRGSRLARRQTEQIIACLQRQHPDVEIHYEVIQTTGDIRRDVPFSAIGTRGIFVKEIEEALLDGRIDVGVHSLKDMPSILPQGLMLACVPPREDPLDALLSRNHLMLEALPSGARIGTSSARRQAQLRALRPDLQLLELRGNLDTRLRKLDEGDYDAILLACAGLNRLGLSERITQRIPAEIITPAPGQGALALEIRADDTETEILLQCLHDADTGITVAAERAFLATLEGGCSLPAGALATLEPEGVIRILAALTAREGRQTLWETALAPREDAEALGTRVALALLGRFESGDGAANTKGS